MKKLFFAFAIAIMAIIYGCNSDDNNPTGGGTVTIDPNTINGAVTFVDTNAVIDTTGGYYSVNAFATWPPTGNPTATAKIKLIKGTDGKYSATYKIIGLNNGQYVVTSAFIKTPYVVGNGVLGLGSFSCDSSSSCLFGPGIQKVTIENNNGKADINFKSFADTSRKIYKF
jgi:hypothetical protein